MTPVDSIKLLRRLTADNIARDGTTASMPVRAGLLLEIIDLALAQADRSPEGQDGETRLDRNDESAVGNADAPRED